jgi:hypothetical protein
MSDLREERCRRAMDAIKQAFGTESGEDNVDLFVEHHLAEIGESYWLEHLGTGTPEPAAVLGLLQFRSSWGKDEIEVFDFTLPNEATDYVVSVYFDEDGGIDRVELES